MKIDIGAAIVITSGVLYAASTVAFFVTARPWLALTYLGYSIGAVGSAMIAMGHR